MRSILFFATLCFLSLTLGPAYSQDVSPVMVPGRSVEMNAPKSYADSNEFKEVFKEFYPLVKPAKPVREQAEQYFQAVSRSFKMQGIDSADAAKAAFRNLDLKAFEKTYFDDYRRNLSAKELKKYMEFLRTPEGKHIAEVWPNLQRASNEGTMYVAKTINMNLVPVREAARAKMEKEHPERKPDKNLPVMIPPGEVITQSPPSIFDQRNAGSQDSLIRTQQMKNRLPKSIDSLSTPHR